MERFETSLEEGTYCIERDGGKLEVGEMDAICDLLGGEEYTLEYDDRAAAVSWLDTDENNQVTIDVRETLADLTFDETFIGVISGSPLDVEGPDGYPQRTAVFVDLIQQIWDSKGNLEAE